MILFINDVFLLSLLCKLPNCKSSMHTVVHFVQCLLMNSDEHQIDKSMA